MTTTTATPVSSAAGTVRSAEAQRPVRRVGSWTLGLVLIVCGLCLLAYHFWPEFDYLMAAKLSPVILVALGVEVLICAARPQKRKYDFFGIFICLVLTAAALCVTFLPVVWEYIGPQREHTRVLLEQQAEERLYARLKGGAVSDASVRISLSGEQQLSGIDSFAALDGTEWVCVSAELTGPYADKEDFAAVCRTVADAVQALPVQVDELTVFWNRNYEDTDGISCHASLVLDSPYKLDWDAETMSGVTEWVYRDIHGTQITEEEWLSGETAADGDDAQQTFYETYEDEYIQVYYIADGGVMVSYKTDDPDQETTKRGVVSYEDENVLVVYDEGALVVEYKPDAPIFALQNRAE